MAITDILELTKPSTGERFYPLTHAEAVIGLSETQFFERYVLPNGDVSIRLKEQYAGLWADGFVSAGGLNSNSGGGGGGSSVSWEQLQAEGTQIATITIDGVSTPVYAPVGGSGGGGTVTRVAAEGANGISVSGSPITGSGTLTIGIGSGYKLPTTSEWAGKQDIIEDLSTIRSNAAAGAAKVSNVQADWNATSGLARILNKPSSLKNPYALSFNGKSYDGSAGATLENSDIVSILGYTPFDAGNVAQTTGQSTALVMSQKAVTDAIASVTETDPVFSASPAAGITAAMIQSWTNKQEPLTAGTDYLTPRTIAQIYQPKMTEGSDYLSPAHVSDRITTAIGGLATVASTGDYGDLLNTPTIPTVNNATLTIQMNGASVGTFTANASSNKTINLGTVLTSFTETDPMFSASPAAGITAPMIQSWNAKADASDLGDYLPLTGGTLTGDLYLSSGCKLNLDPSGTKFLRYTASDTALYFNNDGGTTYFVSSANYIYGGLFPLPTGNVKPNLGSINWLWGNTYTENVVLPQSGTLFLDTYNDWTRSAYIKRGSANDPNYPDYSLYIYAGQDANQNKVNTFIYTNALCPNNTNDNSDIGAPGFIWNNLYAKRWYPDPTNAPNAYIEWDAANGAFKINGPVYSTGQVAAGGLISNS